MRAEIRNIYRASDGSHRMDLFVRELLLGPEVLQMNPFIPPGTKLKASIIKGDVITSYSIHYTKLYDWPEAKARFNEMAVALLPVGSIEQHGPHLPLDTDAFDADYLTRRVADSATSRASRSSCVRSSTNASRLDWISSLRF